MNEKTGESFISNSGGLNVDLNPKDVSWFDFLFFSRATNSVNGGWNSNSYWWERGVKKLSDGKFVQQWTENSLNKESISLPNPRTKNFKFDRVDSLERKNLEATLRNVNNASENELSFAAFKRKIGTSSLGTVDFKGYEIPLSDDSIGQLKVDLFGVSSDGSAIEIIELKQSKNERDSPLMALTEAICYGLQTLRCKESLMKLDVPEGAFGNVHLKILAPQAYWVGWSSSSSLPIDRVDAEFKKIVEQVNLGLASSFFVSKFSVSLLVLNGPDADEMIGEPHQIT